MSTYLLIYLLGLCGGIAANMLLDVRLRRPALSKQITLAALGVLLAIILSQLDAPRLHEWLLAALWAATGALAGLGSRESRAPLA
ncbi:MAG: hypothetical protein M3O34_18390 [Chloroflexota bacterium]|nr:hypothetical protein [Chloroflexota bacterium]